MWSQSAQTRARPRGAPRAGAITSATNIAAAWSTVASWSSSFEPKWAKSPLLLMPVASASLAIESGSRPSWVASAAAVSRIACLVRSPLVLSTSVLL